MLVFDIPYQKLEAQGKQIEREYVEACDWLCELGLYPNGNRFDVYKRVIGEFSNRSETPTETEVHRYLTALCEATELLRIRQTMATSDSEDFLTKLKAITSGQAFRTSVRADPGRDFTFELSVASRFLHGNYEVTLSGLADLTVNASGQHIFIECKRIQSPTKLLRRIEEAKIQIQRRLNSGRSFKNRGMAAIKVTDVVNPEGRHAVMRNVDSVYRHNNATLVDLIKTLDNELKSKIGKRQLCIFFESNLQGIVCGDGTPLEPSIVHCRGGSFYYRNLSVNDEALLDDIAARLRDQHVVMDV